MFARNIGIVALSALSLVSAANFTIDPTEVSLSTRAAWCRGQTNVCDELCGGIAKKNTCDDTDLSFTCTCNNGTAPGLEYYSDSMPTHICEQAFADCNLANVGNAQGQANCTTSIQDKCGKLNAANATTDSGSSSTTTTSASASAKTTTPSTSSSTAAAVPTSIQHLGNGAAAVAAGLFALML